MARRGTFAFDLSKPVKKGMLLKQGHYHRAFKHRFFVLYPGFLVYYDHEQRWATDITKGETLGSRLGAIKLKNGSTSVCRDAPKGCKYGLIISAPDQANKRPTFLMNASSKEERDEWIEALNKSTPHGKSPQAVRKDVKPRNKENHASSPPTAASSSSAPPPYSSPPPSYSSAQNHSPSTARQQTNGTTTENPTSNSESKPEQSLTTKGKQSSDSPPGIIVRHDTANNAALAISTSHSDQQLEKLAAVEEQVTNIDDILGPQATELGSSSDESAPSTPRHSEEDAPSTPRHSEEGAKAEEDTDADVESVSASHTDSELSSLQSPPPSATESVRMEITESVENSVNYHGKLEVVTSVTISVSGEDEEEEEDKEVEDGLKENGEATATEEGEGKNNGIEAEEEEEEMTRKDSQGSTEVVIPQGEDTNCFSVTVTNMGDSDTTSTSDDEQENGDANNDDGDVVSKPVQNGVAAVDDEQTQDSEGAVASSLPPSIMIEVVAEQEPVAAASRTSSGSSGDSSKLVPMDSEKRRASTPFIEKTGFLYKMGGRHKSWKLRFFILAPGAFKYYKRTPNTKPLGEVKLKDLKIFFPGPGERKQSFQFTVHTESSWNKRPNWVLAAQSEREMKDWINAFKLAGQKQSMSATASPAHSEDEGSS